MRACESGVVFDIRRFSTHDGDGIRTSIFLKGCPLRCQWCHNPEGLAPRRRPVWFAGRCIGCGSCAEASRRGGVARAEGGIALDPDAPEDWEAVFDACPTGALRYDAREMRVEEAVEELMRDRVFFARGGGVTLTGGEPLMQSAFCAALLAALKAEGVHTAMETSLYAPWARIEPLLPHVDQLFCDLKHIQDAQHRRLTGVSNARILENLRRLLATDARVTVRTPMIPGATALAENVAGIARFLSGCRADVSYELLNYNPLAPAKYPMLGMRYLPGDELAPLSAEQMDAMASVARENGAPGAFWEA